MLSKVVLLLGILACFFIASSARENATHALDVFLITECEECTADGDSIFCTEAGSDQEYVENTTMKVTIRQKKQMYGAADGAKYCWEGTFGKLLNPVLDNATIFTEEGVSSDLSCRTKKLFYRQCVIDSELTVILIAIGSIVFVCANTCCCFYCGCCRCCNEEGDESRFGMCNRFCPNAPCADKKQQEENLPEHIYDPKTEEEQLSSLFGKNKALNEVTRSNFAPRTNTPSYGTQNPLFQAS